MGRNTFTDDEREKLRREASLGAFGMSTGPVQKPRYPVKSLSDEDLAREVATAELGPWRDACVEERRGRGLSAR